MSSTNASEFLLRLNSPDDQGFYPVEVTIDGIGLWTGGRVKFNVDDLTGAVTAAEYGRRLWAMLVDRDTGWEELRDIPRASGELRLRIMLSVDPRAAELHRIKWELLIPAGDTEPVGVVVDRPLSRFLPLPQLAQRDVSSTRHILLAIANPSNLPAALKPIDVDAEIESALGALESGIRENRIRLTVMPGHTALNPKVQDRLQSLRCTVVEGGSTAAAIGQQLQGKDVLHLIAHGNFDNEIAALVLENEAGALDSPNTKDLILQWSQSKPLLIFLQSCLSDPQDKTLPVAGIGPEFVQRGVPAVIAMRDLVDMTAARIFAAAFYRKLLETGEPDVAANYGRSANYRARSAAWAIPVLYSRLRAGERLWIPDPILRAIRALARAWSNTKEVKDPLPSEVTVVRDLGVVKRELDQPAMDSVVDALGTVFRLIASKERQSRITVILGPRGYAKTAILMQAFVKLAEDPMAAQTSHPVFVRLTDCSGSGNTAAAINHGWIQLLKEEEIELGKSVIRQIESGSLQLFVDGDDDLGPDLLRSTLRRLTDFIRDETADRHMVITMEQSAFDPDLFDQSSTTVLILRDMRAKQLEEFLKRRNLEPEVLQKLTGPLLDLARIPWILSRILDMASDPQNLRSRFQILQRIARNRLSEVSISPGLSSLADCLLQEMAWQLHYRHADSLSLDETYKLLASFRGARDFPLDEFRRSILRCRLWIESGPEGVRFAYNAAHDYFTACYLGRLPPDERRPRLREIVAGLGRLEQLRCWQEVLVLLAGHLREPAELIDLLLELGFGEGEHLLLASRCVHEAQAAGRKIPVGLVSALADSLIWSSLPQSGLPAKTRRRGVDAFSYLIQHDSDDPACEQLNDRLLRHLIRLVLEPVRTELKSKKAGKQNVQRAAALDYSIIRLAATAVLYHHRDITISFLERSKESFEGIVINLIRYWEAGNIEGLEELLSSDQDTVIAGVAAFALAASGTAKAIEGLRKRFFALPIDPDIHWSIIDALTEMQLPAAHSVIREVTHPDLAAEHSEDVRRDLRHFVAYAIGRCGALVEKEDLAYLETCWKSDDVMLQGRAIRSHAEIIEVTVADPNDLRDVCHLVLKQNFPGAQKALGIDPPQRLESWQKRSLTMYIIEALGHVGDTGTIPLLREFYLRPGQGPVDPADQALRRSSWEMAERIRLRYHDQRSNPAAESNT